MFGLQIYLHPFVEREASSTKENHFQKPSSLRCFQLEPRYSACRLPSTSPQHRRPDPIGPWIEQPTGPGRNDPLPLPLAPAGIGFDLWTHPVRQSRAVPAMPALGSVRSKARSP